MSCVRERGGLERKVGVLVVRVGFRSRKRALQTGLVA